MVLLQLMAPQFRIIHNPTFHAAPADLAPPHDFQHVQLICGVVDGIPPHQGQASLPSHAAGADLAPDDGHLSGADDTFRASSALSENAADDLDRGNRGVDEDEIAPAAAATAVRAPGHGCSDTAGAIANLEPHKRKTPLAIIVLSLRLFKQQLRALLHKNVLLCVRSKGATFLHLCASAFFMTLVFCVDRSVESRRKVTTAFRSVQNPAGIPVLPISPCETCSFLTIPCYDFVWSADNYTAAAAASVVVENIMKKNPGRPIPTSKVRRFEDISEANRWLLAHPMKTRGVLHFYSRRSSGAIAYGIQTDSTPRRERGIYEDPTFAFQIPLQLAAEREITRFLAKDPGIQWSVAFKEFSHPNIESRSIVGDAGPIFILAATMFGFVIQMGNVVSERELGLRQAMSTMGLMDGAFWLSWLVWEVLLVCISSLLMVLFGMMFRFYLFLGNSFALLFCLFFLFQLNMTGFAFMLSTFLSKSASARTFGFGFFIVGFGTTLVTNIAKFPYNAQFATYLRGIWSLFPPNLLAIAMHYLGNATPTRQSPGMRWADRAKCSLADPECVITMDEIYRWLSATFLLWFALALYFDNVLRDANGVKKPWYYFLLLSYWAGGAADSTRAGSCIARSTHADHGSDDDDQSSPTTGGGGARARGVDPDVLAEERFVRECAVNEANSNVDDNIAIKVCGLVKSFRSRNYMYGSSNSTNHAVKDLWLHIEKGQLFCLLGPNGAGKTTAIHCLTGVVPVTQGDAIVYGNSIRSAQGMSNIRSFMGVCPQFDVLWNALTGLEHLCLFAKIKGLPPSLAKQVSIELLSRVKLAKDKDLRVGSYSGGMKRRLSVAIAFIGDPKIVYLDEPTSGMDPMSRRQVWGMIEGEKKKGRAIILTTHSMEEADVLSDRIAIMGDGGKLRCIGTSLHLKSKFGAGYIVTVSFAVGACNCTASGGQTFATLASVAAAEHSDIDQVRRQSILRRSKVNRFFEERLGVHPCTSENNDNAAFVTYIIPRNREDQLPDFFAELEGKERELGIADIQISLSTLEEVFLKIAKQADVDMVHNE